MMIIGCDFHPSWQQVSWVDTETGECGERKLVHAAVLTHRPGPLCPRQSLRSYRGPPVGASGSASCS